MYKPRRHYLTAILLIIATFTQAKALAEPSKCNLTQAKTLASQIDQYWQQRDAAGMASLYAEDASLALEPAMGQANGRKEIQQFFGTIFAQLAVGNTHTTSVKTITNFNAICSLEARALVGVPAEGDAAQSKFAGVYLVKPMGNTLQIQWVRAFSLPG